MKAFFGRILAVTMAFCLCVSLAACGGGTQGESGNPSVSSGESQSGAASDSNTASEEPLLPPDTSESALPVGGGGVTVAPVTGQATKNPVTSTRDATRAPETTVSRTVKVTIPEGYNIIQIAKKLEAKGVCSAADFINTAQTYNFNQYSLISNMPEKKYRAFKLEGYLFPDTYEFYKNMEPQDAVGKFLRNGVLKSFSSQVSGSGLKNMDEVLTLASIVEREAKTNTEKNIIAGIFMNRLKKGMNLESDATRDYCINYLKPNTGKYKKFDQPYMEYAYVYNTYNSTCPGLPAGPICNPGRSSIRAVLNPTKTDALYFCYGKDKKLYTAVTYEEHQQNQKTAGLT